MLFIEYASAFIACRFGESGVVGIELPDILIEWNITGVYSAFAVVDDYVYCNAVISEQFLFFGQCVELFYLACCFAYAPAEPRP